MMATLGKSCLCWRISYGYSPSDRNPPCGLRILCSVMVQIPGVNLNCKCRAPGNNVEPVERRAVMSVGVFLEESGSCCVCGGASYCPRRTQSHHKNRASFSFFIYPQPQKCLFECILSSMADRIMNNNCKMISICKKTCRAYFF